VELSKFCLEGNLCEVGATISTFMKASSNGLALMERSVEVFPIALAYRNLAVYWNSEGNAAKTDYYVGKAARVDPNDAYNLVFAAGFMAANGHGDEALKIAREHEDMLPASYNLAAIYAQLGQRDKPLAMLKRHFFGYERISGGALERNHGSPRRCGLRVSHERPDLHRAHQRRR
jgi:tetratricopeptide (TPR) repeat protein